MGLPTLPVQGLPTQQDNNAVVPLTPRQKKNAKKRAKKALKAASGNQPSTVPATANDEPVQAPEEKKPTRDFGAEKLARKAAEMPDVDPDIDLAALRAKAQGAQMTDEEKKARGLLYDTSKASAVRDEPEEDDEGACDFDGGFDWDMEGGAEEEATTSASLEVNIQRANKELTELQEQLLESPRSNKAQRNRLKKLVAEKDAAVAAMVQDLQATR